MENKTVNIITAEIFMGIDWHDDHTRVKRLSLGDNYFIPDECINDIIAKDAFETISEYAETYDGKTTYFYKNHAPAVEDIKNIINNRSEWSYMAEDEYHIATISCDEPDCIIKVDLSTEYEYIIRYYITRIPVDKIAYLPIEAWYAPWKGAFTVQRCYTDKAFSSFEEADAFNKSLPELDRSCAYERYVEIIDADTLNNSEWFTYQCKVINTAKKRNIDIFDDKYFAISVRKHCENLSAA